MRAFDIIGGFAVAAWLIVSGLYVYRNEFAGRTDPTDLGSEVSLSEGETWLVLRRQDEAIGYLHRSNTRLQQGWLLEYDMLLLIEVVGRKLPVDTEVKAKLDEQARLLSFDAKVRAAGRTLAAQGDVDGSDVSVVINPTSNPRRQTISLKRPPRLASSSVHQLIARDDLQPGETFQDEYFDPTSAGMTKIVMEYLGREQIEVMGAKHDALHVRQKVGGTDYDVYLDDRGDILVQEFPLEIIGTRVTAELGRARAASIRKRADSIELPKSKLGEMATGSGVDTALDLLGVGPSTVARPATDQPDAPSPDAGASDAADSVATD